MINMHSSSQHLYADDTQIYDPEMSLLLVMQWLQDVSDWMIAGKFKLNHD